MKSVMSMSSGTDHVYLNISMVNNSFTEVKEATTDVSFDQPILRNMEDYYLSVVRFLIPGQQIPLFKFAPGVYSVTLSYAGVDYRVGIPYIPGFFSQLTPDFFVYSYQQFLNMINSALASAFNSVNVPVWSATTSYYNLNVVQLGFVLYQSLTNSNLNINPVAAAWSNVTNYGAGATVSFGGITYQSLQSSNLNNQPNTNPLFWLAVWGPFTSFSAPWDGLFIYPINAIVSYLGIIYRSLANGNIGNTPNISPASWAPLVTNTSPYLIFNPVTELISLIAPIGFFNSAFDAFNQPLKIWFNTPLYGYFNNFLKIFNGFSPSAFNTNGKNYNIIVMPTGNNDVVTDIEHGSNLAYEMRQEFKALYNWNVMRNIVFKSNSLMIRNEYIPSGDGSEGGISSTSTPILTDFIPSLEDGPQTRSYFQYFPQGEYRLTDFTGQGPLKKLDIQIFWQDKLLSNNLETVFIQPQNSASIKMLFRKKSAKFGTSYN